MRNSKDFWIRTKKRYMSFGIVSSTLKKVLEAPVNMFFDVTPIGKILQIFTEDMDVFQGQIIDPLNHCVNMFAHVCVVTYLLVTMGGWEVVIGFTIMITLMYFIAKPYLHADNQLHKVGSTLWGPIRSYFHETQRGAHVIRAFGQEETIMAKQHEMLDKTTTHFIAHHSCWCWFNLRMFVTSQFFPFIALLVIARNRTTVEPVTLLLLLNWSQDMNWFMHFFGCLNWFMRVVVKAQRCFNLSDIPQEKTEKDATERTPESWPKDGGINFKNVKLRYRPNTDVVLDDLDFKVEPGHKIGVVGRTGAGKSTICMALTRIVELESGSIEIDGVDIAKIPLSELRDQITMIPQEPTLFSGTLRYNLDPFEEVSDKRIKDLINKAGLDYLLDGTSKQEMEDKAKKEEEKKKMNIVDVEDSESEKEDDDDKKKEEDGEEEDGKGLKFKVQEEGKNLSVGERQLICIIRAILRSNKLVILDEATANIDVVTEQAIQRLIKEEFEGATVLTIAHRLNTIINSDRVLMLSAGKVLEYDTPKALLSDPNSNFAKLAEDKKRKEVAAEE